jgi:hypothetical protein
MCKTNPHLLHLVTYLPTYLAEWVGSRNVFEEIKKRGLCVERTKDSMHWMEETDVRGTRTFILE